jgi:hypothetical protein
MARYINEHGCPVWRFWCRDCGAEPGQACGTGLYATERPEDVCRDRQEKVANAS